MADLPDAAAPRKPTPEMTEKQIWASPAHPCDSQKGHLGYGYFAEAEFDGDGWDPPGVRYVIGTEFDRARFDLFRALSALRKVSHLLSKRSPMVRTDEILNKEYEALGEADAILAECDHLKLEDIERLKLAFAEGRDIGEEIGEATVYLPPEERAEKQDGLNRRHSELLRKVGDDVEPVVTVNTDRAERDLLIGTIERVLDAPQDDGSWRVALKSALDVIDKCNA